MDIKKRLLTERLELFNKDFFSLYRFEKLLPKFVNEVDDDIIKNTTILEYLHSQNKEDYDIESAESFLKKKSEDSQVFTIWSNKNENKFIGMVGIHNINKYNQHAEIGYWIGKNNRGCGYVTEALIEIMRYSFLDLNLHKLYAHAYDFNEVSNKVLLNVGFKKIGTKQDEVFRDNQFFDAISYEILENDYKLSNS